MSLSQSSALRRLRFRFLQSYHTVMVLLSVVVGLLGGLCAVGFRKFITLVQTQVWHLPTLSMDGIRAHPAWVVVLVPAAGGLVVGLIIHFFAREAKGHGVPEVMEAVMIRGGRIRMRVLPAKLLASGICIGTGGSVGREGPIVQIGSALGSSIGQLLNLGERRLRTLVGCGAAAGIAATFNAPIAGVLFAAEVILGDFAPTQLTPIVISSVAATVVSHHFFGDIPAFLIPRYSLVGSWELLLYGVLGLVAGLMALLFIKALYAAEDFFDGPLSFIPQPLRTALGGLLIGVMALRFPEVMGVGYEAIEMALHEQFVLGVLVALVGIKILAVSLTIGSGGSGGVFAPSLMIGAMTGGALGTLAHNMWPAATATSGAYALVGAGAVVAAATRAPLTAFMIIFELTNDYKIILPLMISCVIATMLAGRLSRESIYTAKLLRRGLDLFNGRSLNVLRHLKVRDVMGEAEGCVNARTTLLDLMAQFTTGRTGAVFVTGEHDRLEGVITFDDLRPFLSGQGGLTSVIIAYDVMHTEGFPTVRPDDSLDTVMRRLGRYRFEVPVVEGDRLLGTLLVEDVLERYNVEMFKREMAASVVSSIEDTARFTPMPGAAGMSLVEIPVPSCFVGHSCADLELRNQYGVTVLLVRGGSGERADEPGHSPDARYVFSSGDIMLAMGEADSLHKLQNLI
ncbi:chloride channel protein [bacterium CG_4_9_14_3_um_filter_65_15]|nr:MAG: chloride channel protein [bacterium CG_4_9_14_3_um_filter_65_15]